MLGSGRLHGKQEGVAYELRGLAYLDRGDIAHAIADLNQAIALAPDFALAYQNRGNAWYARGNYGQAMADYDTAIKLDPNSPSPYVNRATVRRDLGYVDGALEDYQKAISLGAGGARLYGGRGQLYLRQRDYIRALADFDRALQIEPSAANYMLRGHARQDSGDFERALADYAEAERLDPKTIDAYTRAGRDLDDEGRFRQGHRGLRPRHRRRSEARRDLCLAGARLRSERRPQARAGRHQPRDQNFLAGRLPEFARHAAAARRRYRRRTA